MTNKIVEQIVKMVQDYGRRNGYTFVFVKNDGMLFVDEKADLTEELLKTFNTAKK